MKRFYYAIALPALMLLLWSCNSSGEYVERNGTICYSYWTFSFGTQYHELQGVNPASFKSIENWLGHDNKNVYFKEKLVKGVDIPSIKVKKYPLFGDKNDMYYMGAAMHVANVKGFEVIKWNEDDMWAIDGRCAYYDSIRIDNVDKRITSVLSAMVAPVLTGMIADTALAVNQFRIVNDTLYKVTAPIASGGILTPGTNVIATSIGEQITALLNA
jgi:hypothetical protein